MSLADSIYSKAEKEGKISTGSKFFSVVDKITKVIDGETFDKEVPNGDHTVEVLSEKLGKGKGYGGNEEDQLQLVILDNGQQKEWNMPLKDKEGKMYYLIGKLREIDYTNGEKFLVRAKQLQNGKFGKQIIRLEKGEEIPTINLDEEESGDDLVGGGTAEKGTDDISPETIPF